VVAPDGTLAFLGEVSGASADRPDGLYVKPVGGSIRLIEAGEPAQHEAFEPLDRDAPHREPPLHFRLDRQFGAHLGLELQLALGRAFVGWTRARPTPRGHPD
jgi:hypothetical protein